MLCRWIKLETPTFTLSGNFVQPFVIFLNLLQNGTADSSPPLQLVISDALGHRTFFFPKFSVKTNRTVSVIYVTVLILSQFASDFDTVGRPGRLSKPTPYLPPVNRLHVFLTRHLLDKFALTFQKFRLLPPPKSEQEFNVDTMFETFLPIFAASYRNIASVKTLQFCTC
jgi:hypothetical protein